MKIGKLEERFKEANEQYGKYKLRQQTLSDAIRPVQAPMDLKTMELGFGGFPSGSKYN